MGYEDNLGTQKQSVEHGDGQRMWGQSGNMETATGHRHRAHGDHQGILGLPGDMGTEGKMETAGEVGNKQGIFGLFGMQGQPEEEGGYRDSLGCEDDNRDMGTIGESWNIWRC